MICFLASFIFSPSYLPAKAVIFPYLDIASLISSWYCFCHSISVWSPKVQHITAPEPFSGSAFSSVITGTSKLNNGTVACFPTKSLYRSSVGFTNIQTHAGRSSGLVVAIVRSWFSSLKVISLKVDCFDSSSSSTCAIVVWQVVHQRAGDLVRYSLP